MEQVFNDPTLEQKFRRTGYVLIPGLLDGNGLNVLLKLYEKHKLHFDGPFHTSHFSADVDYKREVHNAIAKEVFEKAKTYLKDYMPLFGNFMIKNPNQDAGMDLHADWTYVDENLHTSVAIWVPLIDVNEENGCFGLIEGSHEVTNLIRGPLIQQSSRDRDHIWAKKFGKLIPMNAGDAIIYTHRLLHYSPPNKSTTTRPAINLSLVPSKAPVVHYCMPEGNNEILCYDVTTPDFYIQYTHFQKPQISVPVQSLPKDTVKYIDPALDFFWLSRLKNKFKHLLT